MWFNFLITILNAANVFNGLPDQRYDTRESLSADNFLQITLLAYTKECPSEDQFTYFMESWQEPDTQILESPLALSIDQVVFLIYSLTLHPQFILNRKEQVPPSLWIYTMYGKTELANVVHLPAQMPPVGKMFSRNSLQTTRVAPVYKRLIQQYTLPALVTAIKQDGNYPDALIFYLNSVDGNFIEELMPKELPEEEKAAWRTYKQ